MYNFGIPSQLKAWIDCLAVPGKTFRETGSGVEGLAGGKRLIIGSSRGNFYIPPSPIAVLDHQESYLHRLLRLYRRHRRHVRAAEGMTSALSNASVPWTLRSPNGLAPGGYVNKFMCLRPARRGF